MSLRSCLPVLLLLAACGDGTSVDPALKGTDYELTGRGLRAGGAATLKAVRAQPGEPTVVGTPTSAKLFVHGVWLSTSASCASPVAVSQYDGGRSFDLLKDPVLARGAVPGGTYRCLLIEMADSVAFTPGTSGGACAAGTEYAIDIYRGGNPDEPRWRGRDGAPITPTSGTDRVVVVFTTDTAASRAAGWAPYQAVPVDGTFTAPGANTYVWDFSNAVMDEGDACGLEPPQPRVE
ncbi:MAG: hypothetical protein NW201_12330 [Gemmatimonadales bacterium]|nr:hypothetical protein [Gemmatimonadales bacterium]